MKQYVFNNKPTDYIIKHEELKVLHGESVFIDVRWSKMGPVITDNGVLDALSCKQVNGSKLLADSPKLT